MKTSDVRTKFEQGMRNCAQYMLLHSSPMRKSGATLKPGNQKPESRIGNRNPESTNQRKQVLQVDFVKIILHSFCL